MKRLILILLLFIAASSASAQERKYESYEQLYTFEEIARHIESVFPEAYITFLDISFYQQSGRIVPGEAKFYIPTKYFKKKKLTEDIVRDRTKRLIERMGDPGTCEQIELGKSKKFSWSEWQEKEVTPITIKFFIGC